MFASVWRMILTNFSEVQVFRNDPFSGGLIDPLFSSTLAPPPPQCSCAFENEVRTSATLRNEHDSSEKMQD